MWGAKNSWIPPDSITHLENDKLRKNRDLARMNALTKLIGAIHVVDGIRLFSKKSSLIEPERLKHSLHNV